MAQNDSSEKNEIETESEKDKSSDKDEERKSLDTNTERVKFNSIFEQGIIEQSDNPTSSNDSRRDSSFSE